MKRTWFLVSQRFWRPVGEIDIEQAIISRVSDSRREVDGPQNT